MGDTRTVGAVHLARLGKKDAIVAARIGCDRTLLVRWRSGARKPTNEQKALLQRFYGIESWEWDVSESDVVRNSTLDRIDVTIDALRSAIATPDAKEVVKPPTKAPPVASSTITTPGDEVIANARVLQQKAMQLCDEVKGGTPEERVSILEKSARVVAITGKLLGEDSRVSKAKILRSPEWGEIQNAIFEALKPYPEAFEAVVEKIQGLNV